MRTLSSATIVVAMLSCGCVADAAPREDYGRVKTRIEVRRNRLAKRFREARSKGERRRVLALARSTALSALRDQILPAWYGTAWAFSGRSDTPKQGAIACGTFVGTVLRDVGFRLNRIAMGRLASEHIALSLTTEARLRRYSDRPAIGVEREVQAWGPGLYMIGLDYHAGLVLVDAARKARFIHSSGYRVMSVVSESLTGDNPFALSRYRVVAKLLDDRMMTKWLRGARFVARKVQRR